MGIKIGDSTCGTSSPLPLYNVCNHRVITAATRIINHHVIFVFSLKINEEQVSDGILESRTVLYMCRMQEQNTVKEGPTFPIFQRMLL